MSGEFGSYSSGYFHTQIECAADDLAGARDALSREWGKFFAEFAPVARAISWSEASDSGPAYPINETLARIPKLKEILGDIERHVAVYKEVADDAVRKAVKKANGCLRLGCCAMYEKCDPRKKDFSKNGELKG